MNGFFTPDLVGGLGTWVAVLLTVGVWSYAVGERTIFRLLQLLLAGLATGYLALLAIHHVLLPRLLVPLVTDAPNHPLLFPAVALVAVMAGAAWLPRRVVAPVAALLVAGVAAFALGGAIVGTLLPQMAAALIDPATGGSGVIDGFVALAITILVLLAFLHGSPRGRFVQRGAGIGRWLLIGGIGAWFGFLLVSRLSLLVDRVAFLLGDWLGLLR
ncbi:MAG: hypothetical protein E6J47_01175 [Chloroflexi bacterium]|nr:MAG: hypothetical protein E6J47_01175 [Chloroflexota bacterium]